VRHENLTIVYGDCRINVMISICDKIVHWDVAILLNIVCIIVF